MVERNITGKNIKKIRISKKITQKQLVIQLNKLGLEVDRTMISKMENQIRKVYDYEVKAIATALEVRIDELFKIKK